MTKKLFDALSSIEYTVVSSDGKTPIESDKSLNPEISSLVFDSRDVKPGALFFALPGTHTTGNVFIPKAIENGAAAIVFEGELDENTTENAVQAQPSPRLAQNSPREFCPASGSLPTRNTCSFNIIRFSL